MPRPKKKRSIHRPPLFSEFKPTGIRASELQPLELALDEFEAIRLADFLGLDHAESAENMEISRSTFSRLVEKARYKIGLFLTEGRHLRIEGGEIHFQKNLIRCQRCGHMFNMTFDADLNRCPSCGSSNLIDLAGGYGHGNCCQRHHNRHRR